MADFSVTPVSAERMIEDTFDGNSVIGQSPVCTSFSPEVILLTITVLLLLLLWVLQNNQKSLKGDRYLQLPGPLSLPLIGPLYQFAKPGFDLLKMHTEWQSKYGRILKGRVFFTDVVVITEPLYVQKILTLPKPQGINKPRVIYDAISGYTIANGVLFSEYPVWSHHRKVVQRSLAYSGILDHLRKLNFHTNILINKLIAEADLKMEGIKGLGDHSITKLLNATALEIILHTIMDLEITTQEERQAVHKHLTSYIFPKWLSLRIRWKNENAQLLKQPWLLLSGIHWLHPVSRRKKLSLIEIKKFMKMVTGRYEKRREEMKGKAKMENVDADSTENETGNGIKLKGLMEEMLDAGFSDDDIFQEALTMIYAGHETSSWGIIFLWMRLALNPEIQSRCRKEVDDVYEKKIHNKCPDVDLTISDLRNMEYMDMCVKECLRLTPIVPGFARRLDDGPVELDKGLWLQKGTIVTFPIWAMHRIPEIFPEPEKFDPDRFLPEECAKRHPFSYLPFSAGVRNCMGSKIASLNIKLATALILRHFQLETTDRWEDVNLNFDVTLTTKKDVNLILKKRSDII